MIYPFNERGDIENVKNTALWSIYHRVMAGDETPEDREYIADKLMHNSFSNTGIPLLGVMFDFSELGLKTYVVKQFGTWSEYKALNKTSLRAAILGRVDKIVQID